MAKLSKAARSNLPSSKFAGPGDTYPVEDADHARAAILDSAAAERAGYITAAQRAAIVAKADAELKAHPLHP